MMNKILFLLLFTFFVLAKDTDIPHLISKIRQAPQSQKRVLINQLKLKLRNTNIHQRHEIFAKLKDLKNTKNRQHKQKGKHRFKNKNHNPKFQHKQLRLHKKQNSNSSFSPKSQHQKGKKH